MDASHHDSQIRACKTNLEEQFEKLEVIRNDFIGSTAVHMSSWFTETVEKNIRSKPEHAKQLGPERLRKLKTALNELVTKSDCIAAEGLNSADLWPLQQQWGQLGNHHSSAPFDVKKVAGEGLRKAVNGLLGPVGRLLIEAGFVTDNDSEWLCQSAPTPKHSENYCFEWSSEMKAKWKQYEETAFELARSYDALKQAERSKVQAEAIELWEKA